ncbi:MAG: ABC transporter substrate-binding protein [Woeseiaceae bacterium]
MTLSGVRFVLFLKSIRWIGLLCCAWLLASCSVMNTGEQSSSMPADPEVTSADPEVASADPEVAILDPKVAIVLSLDIPDFNRIADALGVRLGEGNYSVHHLNGKPENGRNVQAEILAEESNQLVAVGLLAAKFGRTQQIRPMVFSQVYDYQKHNLVSLNSRGVAFLPPFDLQFESWRQLSPDLVRVGVVTGPNQEELLEQIRQAAAKKNIEVLSRTVESDKEALLEFRRLAPRIQGLLILPDNRVLSPGSLRETMAIAAKRRTQVAVYSPGLLDFGALLSFSGTPEDVAKNIDAGLRQYSSNGEIPGPELRSLTAIDVRVNPVVAGHLSLSIPAQYALTARGN